MKVKFRVVDPKTQKVHRIYVKGRDPKDCNKILVARLILMGVKQPNPDDIQCKIIRM